MERVHYELKFKVYLRQQLIALRCWTTLSIETMFQIENVSIQITRQVSH